MHYNACRRNYAVIKVLGIDAKPGLDTFSYPSNNYQPAIERHNAISQALTNAKAILAKKRNLHWTLDPQHKVRDKVLVSTKNMKMKNILVQMHPFWMGRFTILSANYNCNNNSLDLSSDSSLNLTYNIFYIGEIKSYVNNNYTLFPE